MNSLLQLTHRLKNNTLHKRKENWIKTNKMLHFLFSSCDFRRSVYILIVSNGFHFRSLSWWLLSKRISWWRNFKSLLLLLLLLFKLVWLWWWWWWWFWLFLGLFLNNNSMPESIKLFLRCSTVELFVCSLLESICSLIFGKTNRIGFWSHAGTQHIFGYYLSLFVKD